MYIIYMNRQGQWVLRLRAKHLKKEMIFKKYIHALESAQMLQLNLNKFDRRGQVLIKKAG